MKPNAMMMPALWGGLAIGLLSGLPVVSIGNCCCCLWIVSGGVISAYLLQANSVEPIALGDGALAGLLAGLFGAFVHTVVSVPVNLLTGPLQQQMIGRLMELSQDVPAEARQMLDSLGTQNVTALAVVTSFVFMLVIGAVFASLGGLLGAVFFRKKTPAIQPPPFPGTPA
jgi:hypothetical protein